MCDTNQMIPQATYTKEHIMHATRTIVCLYFLIGLIVASCLPPFAAGQQAIPTPTIEQEFFDAIRKGDSSRVDELLKQRPELIKATYKNGITPVLYAVYAKHPEIAESFIATGI